jgi:alkanesulfonate monooxygenase SsuD/methylene tetrahydromethanopterin reductase-like flavin-dependent oxidoreductase (luciferase family)
MTSANAVKRAKIGMLLPQWEKGMDRANPGWSDIEGLARMAEQMGFDSLWVVDHLLIDRGKEMAARGHEVPEKLAQADPLGVWECWTLLAALAAVTEKVELGPLVSCNNYRNPALLAKIVETIDEISGGRVILGIGAGDYPNEHRTFGFGDMWARRVSRFEEALKIIAGLLREGRVDFQGEHYQLEDCVLRPRGPRPGRIPIMIGSPAAKPRMARLTMEYADSWNCWLAFGTSTPEEAGKRMQVIDEACERHGRDPSSLERTLTIGVGVLDKTIPGANPVTGEPGEIAETIHQFIDQGYSHIQVYLAPMTPAGFEQFNKVLDELRA